MYRCLMEHIIIQQQYRFLLCDSFSLIKEDLNIENKVWEKLDVYSTYETASGNSEITAPEAVFVMYPIMYHLFCINCVLLYFCYNVVPRLPFFSIIFCDICILQKALIIESPLSHNWSCFFIAVWSR